MPNSHVLQRLAGIQSILMGVHQSSASLSSSSRGNEREAFVNNFLSNVLPPIYRFGTGDVTDAAGNRSGQLDVVVEYPFSPSLPTVGGGSQTRLYLAESVAAVVEVKSNIASQWKEAEQTAAQLAPLQRKFSGQLILGPSGASGVADQIPVFVVGYTGWQNPATVEKKVNQNPDIAGVLVIDNGIFVSSDQYQGIKATGPWALWGLISALHQITNSLQGAATRPLIYGT